MGLAPYPTLNLEGLGFLSGYISLAKVSCYLKGARYPPFAFVAQLQYNCITGVMTRTCDSQLGGRAYDTVGISWHLRSTPGGLSTLHQDPLPPFILFVKINKIGKGKDLRQEKHTKQMLFRFPIVP